MSNGAPQSLPEDEIVALRARITELEKKLATCEPYVTFFERSPIMLCVADSKGHFERLNSSWEDTLGWSLQEIYARPFLDFVHPDDVASTLQAVERLTSGSPAIGFENRYLCKDGSYRNLRWFSAPLDENGRQHAAAQDITAQRQSEERARVFQEIITRSATGMIVLHLDQPGDSNSLRIVMANEAAKLYTGADLRDQIGRRLVDVIPLIVEMGLPEIYMDVAMSGGSRDLGEVSRQDTRAPQNVYWVKVFALSGHRVCVTFEDITARKRAEEALRKSLMQEQIIKAQTAALAELSTPLIPVSDDVVVMPLIGTVDSTRAEQAIHTLLDGVSRSNARTAILDITGVAVVDTQVAEALVRAARGVKLLGARVMLTGIRPDVARTLVELAVDLGDIVTHASLQAGIAAAFRSRR